ncbi:hypothetical protein CRG98_007784 [Punica granatum]|uniref:Uncharacterized protein n=1 Tax=Punica granatum TaxID=22663 RepID=A0A2I0KTN4_PUNGR|nr:hypothetical protein CRG98_007784 [Punica granatum]
MIEEDDWSDGVDEGEVGSDRQDETEDEIGSDRGDETSSNGSETFEPRAYEYEDNEDDDEEFFAEENEFVDKIASDKAESSRQRMKGLEAVVRAQERCDDIVIPEFDYQRHLSKEYHGLIGSDDEDNGIMHADFARHHLAVNDYNIYLGRVVKFKKNDKIRYSAACVVEHYE